MEILAQLPVHTLRVGSEVTAALHRLGIETIGQLMELPRETLPARFGPILSRRLDEAIGAVPEPIAAMETPAQVEARYVFEYPITSPQAIEIAIERLIDRIVKQLDRLCAGARTIRLEMRRAYAPALEKTVELTRPSRDPREINNLLQCAIEMMNDGIDAACSGIVMIVPRWEKTPVHQISLDGKDEDRDERELGRLIQRLSVRLGKEKVAAIEPIEAHLPELAWSPTPALHQHRPVASTWPAIHRPLCMLDCPVEIPVTVAPSQAREGRPVQFVYGRVRRVVHAVGPERLHGPWWEGRSKSRDYFDAVRVRQGERLPGQSFT